jgi:hypothetical protein
MTINNIETGLVYRNPFPECRSIHAWHPTLAIVEGGQLLVGFDLGEAIASRDYRTHMSRSADGGRTWSPPESMFADQDDRLQRQFVRIKRLRDGSLVATGARICPGHEDEESWNHETFGQRPTELIMLRSHDEGRTWEGPVVVQPPLEGPFEICHTVVELDDGRWLWPVSITRGWDGSAPDGVKAIALVSHDAGRTWPEFLTLLDSYAQGVMHLECSLAQLPDGRLLSVSWAYDVASGTSGPLPYTLSSDGQSFFPPRPTGILSETSKLLSLGDDRVLCVYRRTDKPGLWGNLVRIEGDAWVHEEEALLWEGVATKMFGERSAGEELAALALGFPQPHRLPDGDVIVLFWCREGCIHNIRWVRFSV